jgi:ATP-dependent DNA helicase PIF1
LRNLNSPRLCNGTRLLVTSLTKNIIEAEISTGCAKGEKIFLPKISYHYTPTIFQLSLEEFNFE